ncbi:hypothetical protein CDL15_Pgr000539 [Punica granatum]|uniref:Uncharacterized protein n=1 Tax=Punica granatum TaxID=22663 RepID=A0A218W2M0_PUNGR|nr:hypothetical protein CDL15_Pgr000539 [Punica granatum]
MAQSPQHYIILCSALFRIAYWQRRRGGVDLNRKQAGFYLGGPIDWGPLTVDQFQLGNKSRGTLVNSELQGPRT